jgi:plastocyanin
MSLSSSRLATSLIVLGLACGDTGPTTPVASTFTLFGGNNQVSPAGQQLATALGVIARNTSGNPVGGVTVNWAVTSGGGSVAPMSTTTDSGGRASSNWTLGPNAGTQTATATVTGLAPVTFTAIGRIQGAVTVGAKFQRQLLDTVLATTPDFPVIAQALNESNVPVQGVIVNWTASGGGAVSQAVDTTDAGGESQVNYTYGATAGTYGAQATVTGLVGSPVNFTLTAGAGNPTVLAGHAGNNLNAAPGTQVIHTVITRDSHGNPRNGVTIDWALGTGGGSLSTNQNITGGDGTASVTRTIGLTNPNQTVTATAAGLPGGPSVTFTTIAVFTVTVGPGTAFSPNNLTIPLHFPVKFLWATGNTLLHNVTFDPITGAPATITDRTAGDVNTAWHDPGTFTYQCTNHPGMTGQIVVQP